MVWGGGIVGSGEFTVRFIGVVSRCVGLAITLMYCNRLHAW